MNVGVVHHSRFDRRLAATGQNQNCWFTGTCQLPPAADMPPAFIGLGKPCAACPRRTRGRGAPRLSPGRPQRESHERCFGGQANQARPIYPPPAPAARGGPAGGYTPQPAGRPAPRSRRGAPVRFGCRAGTWRPGCGPPQHRRGNGPPPFARESTSGFAGGAGTQQPPALNRAPGGARGGPRAAVSPGVARQRAVRAVLVRRY
jgi:hypothetical protein